MSEMVERVAKVVAEHFDYDLDHLPKTLRDEWLQAARTAIEAMREPTEDMLHPLYGSAHGPGPYIEAKALWQDMIDGALK